VVPEELFEYRIPKIDRVGDEFVGDVVGVGASKIPYQFGQAVFVGIHHHQFGDFELQDGFDVGGANGTGATNDQHPFPIDTVVQFVIIFQKILCQKTFFAFGNVVSYELFKVEICLHSYHFKGVPTIFMGQGNPF
jgi:hypothetical protein